MNDDISTNLPPQFNEIKKVSEALGFTLTCDLYTGSILRTLATSKPSANILELGTGTGLSLAWIVNGMDDNSKVLSIDNDPKLVDIANSYFQNDNRVSIECSDGKEWLESYHGEKFDLVFADAYPGKIFDKEKVLDLIKVGGFYVIDDLTIKPEWSDEHQQKIQDLTADMERLENFQITKLNWSTGLIIAAKKY